jgi:hypothetical protein
MTLKPGIPAAGFAVATLLLLFMATVSIAAPSAWQAKLHRELPLLGHRNWIVVADSAYPLQTAPGIETVYADADQLEVLKAVLEEFERAKHVKPIIYTDAELKFLSETDAPGINMHRKGLARVFGERPIEVLPHEQIISKLDEAGKTFKVLLIKTPLALPYTSVFLQLDCGYWNAEAEKRLRTAMESSKNTLPEK